MTSTSSAHGDHVRQFERELRLFYNTYVPSGSRSSETLEILARRYVRNKHKLFAYLRAKYATSIESFERDKLDFQSPSFDPLLALYSRSVSLPDPTSAALDNVHKCRSLLPESDVFYDGRITRGVIRKVDETKNSKRSKCNAPFENVSQVFCSGPMSVLSKCFSSRSKVYVRTRSISGERGSIVGTLDAFDKHMNMVLKDAKETYNVTVRGEDVLDAIKVHGSRVRMPKCLCRQEIRPEESYVVPVTRHVRYLLVRGDMVIIVSHPKSDRKDSRR